MAKKDAAYWREKVAAAASIEMCHVTQFSPKGLGAALGQPRYWIVQLGSLVLQKDGEWVWLERGASTAQRLKYAHATAMGALAALRAEVAPDEPACAQIIEPVYKGRE